jgi:hypothetical protein
MSLSMTAEIGGVSCFFETEISATNKQKKKKKECKFPHGDRD